MLKKIGLGLLIALTALAGTAPSASALCPQNDDHDTPPPQEAGFGNQAEIPPDDQGQQQGGGCATNDGTPVPCSQDGGTWNGICYMIVVSDDPWDTDPRLSPIWNAFSHSPGVLRACTDWETCSMWSDHGPRWYPTDDPTPSAAELEEAARLSVQGTVTAPGLGVFPGELMNEANPKAMGLVGAPAWFWAVDPGPGIASNLTKWSTVHGHTLTATVAFRKTVYDITGHTNDGDPIDAATVVCHNLGDDPDHRIHQPTVPPRGCYHTFDKRGTYHITATTHLDVQWSGAGQSGTLPEQLVVGREGDYHIGEIQVLIIPDR